MKAPSTRARQILYLAQAQVEKKSSWPRDLRGYTILAWLVLIHITAVVGLIVCPIPGVRVMVASVGLSFLGGAGTSVCYHRALAHQSLKLHPVVQAILIFFAMLNGATAPGNWVSTHRLHHATADTPDDPSSPVWHGWWWAHVAWHWRPLNPRRTRYDRDFKTSGYAIWRTLMLAIFAIAFFGGALLGADAFFWLGAIRLVFFFHGVSFVNSVCHTEPGTQAGDDASRNVVWLSLMQYFIGENWHRNHHADPRSARFGRNWKQVDLGYVIILVLERMRLATAVRRPAITKAPPRPRRRRPSAFTVEAPPEENCASRRSA